MRGYQETRGRSFRLVYDRERAEFVYRVEPHPFLARVPMAEVGTGDNIDKAPGEFQSLCPESAPIELTGTREGSPAGQRYEDKREIRVGQRPGCCDPSSAPGETNDAAPPLL